jgi:hypothetical protein
MKNLSKDIKRLHPQPGHDPTRTTSTALTIFHHLPFQHFSSFQRVLFIDAFPFLDSRVDHAVQHFEEGDVFDGHEVGAFAWGGEADGFKDFGGEVELNHVAKDAVTVD